MELARRDFRLSKKGFMFVLDALLASIILVGGLLLISQHLLTERSSENLEYLTTDMLSVLYELKMSDINAINSSFYINNLSSKSAYTNENLSVMEQIGAYWAVNEPSLAAELSNFVMNNVFPKNMGFNMSLNLTVVFNQSLAYENYNSLVAGQRMITGIKGNVDSLTGNTSSAYLQRIYDKRTSSFAYFGGFVGQGNITVNLERIPDDVIPADITRILIELDAVSSFNVVINGVFCTTLNASNTTMTPERWDITFCNTSIVPGTNSITLDFQGDINNAYVMGGNIRVEYKTDELQQTISLSNKTYMFPNIIGVVNLYDSFYVPGDLIDMNIYLHYLANHSITALNNTFYLTIGDTIVFNDTNSTTDQNVTLNDTILQAILDYSDLNGKTIPLRMGFANLTYETVVTESGDGFGDIIVTTDVSGSMDWEFDHDWDDGVDRGCSDPLLYDPSSSRISVARCVDKIFVEDVLLNTTLNRIGLVSYSDDTDSTLGLTNDQDLLEDEINSYSADGATCISCGITDAYNLLSSASPPQLHKDVWKYDVNHQTADPDPGWYTLSYDDSSWPEGNVPFGYKVSGVTTVLDMNNISANLWEYRSGSYNDVLGPPNDFSSGRLNSTRNTYGLNVSGDDGWDNKTGVYGGGGTNVDIIGVYQYSWWPEDYELRIDIDGTSSSQTSDGSYGIQFNVTQQMRNILSNGGYAVVSFGYRWVDDSWNNFENEDEAWVKARITNTTGQSIYLGSLPQCDAGHQGNDSTLEVGCINNPDNDFSGTFSQDITSIITATGSYYLDFGGKVTRNSNSEDGIFYFDNVQISFVSNVGNTYYRNAFALHNLTRFSNAKLYVASDNNAEVFLNGNLIDNDTATHTRSYWNRIVDVNISKFVEGDNILAAKLRNNDDVSGFLDIELRANMTGRQSAILIMSDGDANRCVRAWDGDGSENYCDDCSGRACCPNPTTGQFNVMCPNIANLGGSSDGYERAFEQVINTSCYLHNKYNISIYSVAFGTAVSINGTKTLNLSAACDNASHFYTTTNISAIADIYQDIASSVVSGFYVKESQALVISGGNLSDSNLYGDSHISYTYTPVIEPPEPNEISVEMQSAQFNNCSVNITMPSGIRIADAKVTSYSGQHWTRTLSINSNLVYDLSEYNTNFTSLGDPYIIHAPPNLFVNGSNVFYIDTGDDSLNSTGCSQNNSLIYTALVPSSTARSSVVQNTIGCNWTIQFVDDTFSNKIIPVGCSGAIPCPHCSYTAANHTNSYDPTDAYDIAVFNLLKELDFDDNGKIFVNLDATDIEIIITTITSVPYLWGPTLVKARVWQ